MYALKKEITLNVVNRTGMVLGNSGRLGQALGNLISNAIKYSPHGSEVTIWTDDLGDSLRICVADQGPGVPEEERERLFTQFGKLSARPTDGESSTGLGLWITKVLVNLQRGDVGVHSPTEGGSIFWIEMPDVPAPSVWWSARRRVNGQRRHSPHQKAGQDTLATGCIIAQRSVHLVGTVYAPCVEARCLSACPSVRLQPPDWPAARISHDCARRAYGSPSCRNT